MKKSRSWHIVQMARRGPITSRDVADALGITRQRAAGSLADLEQRGTLKQTGTVKLATGRPTNIWSLA